MPSITFEPCIIKEYTQLQQKDKTFCKKFNALLNDISRHATQGLGKPERLKGKEGNVWSRRIDDKNRIVYEVQDNGNVSLLQITGHYEDK